MKEYTYIAVLFFTVIICFIASFDKRLRFYKHFSSFIISAIIVGIPFILWDVWFTKHDIWWFDTSYTLGLTFWGLPLEEILFFIFIPFSCIFTFFCLDKFFDLRFFDGFNNIIVFCSVIILSVISLKFPDRSYTLITAIVTIFTLVYFHFIKKISWIGRASLVFSILMLGFFPVNGILTGSFIDSPIVNYNPKEFLGIRMGTIPIEDAVYGYTQFLWVLYFFKYFSNRQKNA